MVAILHLHYLRHRIKYGNLEAGNTTKKLLSTTGPCCSIESIESILFFLVILVTCNIGIYICIYIYKVSYIHSIFVCLFFWGFFIYFFCIIIYNFFYFLNKSNNTKNNYMNQILRLPVLKYTHRKRKKKS